MGDLKMHDQSAHNLGFITGYIVEQTIKNGVKLEEPLVRNRLDAANKYGEALALVQHYRKIGYSASYANKVIKTWAVIRAVYSDGCVSEPF